MGLRDNKYYQIIRKSDISRRFAQGAFWSLFGTAVGKILVLIAGIICARILGKEVFGQFSLLRSTINMFLVFGSAGLGLTATKYISEYLREEKKHVVSIYKLTIRAITILALIISISVFFTSGLISSISLHDPNLNNAVKIVSIILFITSINIAQNGALIGFEDFKSIALNTLFGSTVEFVAMIVGAKLSGLEGALLGFGIGWLIVAILNRVALHRQLRVNGIRLNSEPILKEDYKKLYNFTLPATLSSILVLPVLWYCRSLLTGIENGNSELGIFEAAYQWRIILMFIPTSLAQIILPILSSLTRSDNQVKYKRVLYTSILLNGVVALAIALVVYFCRDMIMHSYGDDFDNTKPLTIMVFSTVFSSIANALSLSISSRAKMWASFLFNIIWSLLMIAITIYTLRIGMGSEGVSWAIFFSYGTLMIVQYIYVRANVLKS